MNSHEEIRSQLAAYSSGELAAGTEQRVKDHLATCPECRAELAELETIRHLLRTTPSVEPPPWLTPRIMARLSEQQSCQDGWLRRLFLPLHIKLPLEAAALLVVCLTGWYLTRTVETELKQQPLRTDMPEQASPAAQPEITKPAADQPQSHVKRAAPTQMVPQPSTLPMKQPAPLTRPAAPEALPPPTAGNPPSFLQSAPKAETADRLRQDASEAHRKAYKGAPGNEAESFAPAPAGRATGKQAIQQPPVLSIRLETTDPAAAPAAIRDAAELSGGYLSNDRAVAEHRITVTVPERRLAEFYLRLSRTGRLPQQPRVSSEQEMIEVTVSW